MKITKGKVIGIGVTLLIGFGIIIWYSYNQYTDLLNRAKNNTMTVEDKKMLCSFVVGEWVKQHNPEPQVCPKKVVSMYEDAIKVYSNLLNKLARATDFLSDPYQKDYLKTSMFGYVRTIVRTHESHFVRYSDKAVLVKDKNSSIVCGVVKYIMNYPQSKVCSQAVDDDSFNRYKAIGEDSSYYEEVFEKSGVYLTVKLGEGFNTNNLLENVTRVVEYQQ